MATQLNGKDRRYLAATIVRGAGRCIRVPDQVPVRSKLENSPSRYDVIRRANAACLDTGNIVPHMS